MSNGLEDENLTESVEELRIKLEAMKRLIEEHDQNEENERNKSSSSRASIIDGNFLSTVFVIVLFLIISVSAYAFFNLYVAVRKKLPGQHTEL